jgi:hypothetical protein
MNGQSRMTLIGRSVSRGQVVRVHESEILQDIENL